MNLLPTIRAFEAGNFDEAEMKARAVLAEHPEQVDALHILGVLRGLQGEHSEAEKLLARAAKQDGTNSFILFNLSKALMEQAKFKQAADVLKLALELDSKQANFWLNYGNALYRLSDLDGAIFAFDCAITLSNDLAEAYSNKASCLAKKLLYKEALLHHERAIQLNPKRAEFHNNLGITLSELGEDYAAIASYERALKIRPEYAQALANIGISLDNVGRSAEAEKSLSRSVEINKNYAEGFYNRGCLKLKQRRLAESCDDFGWRWNVENCTSQPLKTSLPRATSPQLCGHLLLWAEQGLGDEIFYSGMLSSLLSTGAKISLSADGRLHSVFRRSFPSLKLLDSKATKTQAINAPYDSHLPIGDLIYFLQLQAEEIKNSRGPFLVPDIEKSSRLKKKILVKDSGLICGISWKSKNKELGKSKSIELKNLLKPFRDQSLNFVNLQYGEVDSEIKLLQDETGIQIQKISEVDLYNDIDGLLALIHACDFVITTSNVTAHLAGSVGKKGCVLVPFSRGRLWYWHINDDYSFWYPSLKIFYQDETKNWRNTIDKMGNWIRNNFQ